MGFDKRNDTVEEGDTVVLYFGRQNINPLEINRLKTFQSKFGAFHHKHMIGQRYGCKMHSKKGWGYLLRPTPELWTVSLPHRTQILYTMDISMITMELELRPGSIVVESGTGSGSLSHAIIRTIKPTGHLYTFDFHQSRVQQAKKEFNRHFGAGKYVTCACADACVDGFKLEDKADAVFLDLPTPWEAISHAKTALKKSGGRLCSFSPCIEQVQRTCAALRQAKFCEIKTVEVLVRSLVVQTTPIPEMVFDSDVTKLEANHDAKKQKLDTVGDLGDEKMLAEANGEDSVVPTMNDVAAESEELNRNSPNEDGERKANQEVEEALMDKGNDNPSQMTGLTSLGMVTKTVNNQSKKGNVNMVTCKPTKEVTGHTGYLTFASLLPDFVNDNS